MIHTNKGVNYLAFHQDSVVAWCGCFAKAWVEKEGSLKPHVVRLLILRFFQIRKKKQLVLRDLQIWEFGHLWFLFCKVSIAKATGVFELAFFGLLLCRTHLEG